MRSATKGLSRGAVCAVALMSWVYGPTGAAANDEAAHALAQKFSQAADEGARADEQRNADARAKAEAEARKRADVARRKAAEAQRAADEAEMLRSAQEEAAARQVEQARIAAEREKARGQAAQLAEEARQQRIEREWQAEEARRAEAERLTREAQESRAAEERRIAAEKAEAERKAEEARLAEARRRAEEAKVAEIRKQAEEAEAKRRLEESRVADLKRQAEEADAKRRAEEQRLTEQRKLAEQQSAQQRAALEAQREAEAQRVAEKFRLAREAREHTMATRNSLGGPLPDDSRPAPLIAPPAAAKLSYPQRVTVLVVMQPRRHGFAGSRMTANPVLCVGNDCYVSNGAGSYASAMRRGQALGPANTLGRNAGACRNRTTCVFRGVTLPAQSQTIQPVDMGFLHHDRREIRTAEPDRSCDFSAGHLVCAEPIIANGYRAWIVPEAVAERAGTRVLERALDAGLPAARSVSAGAWSPTVQALPTR